MQHDGTDSGSVMADGNTGASSVYNNNVQDPINYALDHPQLRTVSVSFPATSPQKQCKKLAQRMWGPLLRRKEVNG